MQIIYFFSKFITRLVCWLSTFFKKLLALTNLKNFEFFKLVTLGVSMGSLKDFSQFGSAVLPAILTKYIHMSEELYYLD